MFLELNIVAIEFYYIIVTYLFCSENWRTVVKIEEPTHSPPPHNNILYFTLKNLMTFFGTWDVWFLNTYTSTKPMCQHVKEVKISNYDYCNSNSECN